MKSTHHPTREGMLYWIEPKLLLFVPHSHLHCCLKKLIVDLVRAPILHPQRDRDRSDSYFSLCECLATVDEQRFFCTLENESAEVIDAVLACVPYDHPWANNWKTIPRSWPRAL